MLNLGLSREALIERRNGLGGSDADKIIEGKWYELWLDKTGQKQPKKIMSDWNSALRHTTETLQLDWYEHINSCVVSRRGEVVVSRHNPFLRCTLDGWVANLGVPINAKHVSKWTKEAREWAIQHYTPQMTHEAIVTNADSGLLSLLHGEKEPEIISIECDPIFAAQYVAKAREFWGYVERREPPPDAPPIAVPDVATEVKRLRTILLDELTPGGTDWPNWAGEFIRLAHTFAETDGAAKVHAIARKTMLALPPDDAGLVRYGLVTYKRDGRGQSVALKKEKDDAAS